MPVYNISHETVYCYSCPVAVSQHLAHLLPRPVNRQHWRKHKLEISPTPTMVQERTDIFGNRPITFSIEEEHLQFSIKASGQVEVGNELLPETSLSWEDAAERLVTPQDEEDLEAAAFAFPSPMVCFDDAISNYVSDIFTPGRPLLSAALELNSRIFEEFTYVPASTRIGTMPPEILRERHGVCQDFAHFMAACLRSRGLACRYISGYLLTKPPEGQEKLVGADATHAWISVYLPSHGWVELDPTNNLVVGDEHIIVAWGRDFSDVSPLKGVIMGGGPHTVNVAVSVEPLP